MTGHKVKIYNRIRVLRISQGLSRESLAEKVGVNRQTIGYLEREEYNPSIALALKTANIFQLSVEQVFSLAPFESLATTIKETQT